MTLIIELYKLTSDRWMEAAGVGVGRQNALMCAMIASKLKGGSECKSLSEFVLYRLIFFSFV